MVRPVIAASSAISIKDLKKLEIRFKHELGGSYWYKLLVAVSMHVKELMNSGALDSYDRPSS